MTNTRTVAKPRVALYVRVSKDDGSQTYENQLLALRAMAQQRGWEIVAEYTDKMSGAKSKRVGFANMLTDARQGKFNLLMFWSLDRLSREGTLETLQYLQQLTSCGVDSLSLQEAYIDSIGPFRDAVIGIMATIAKMERQRLIERTNAGLARARKHGTKSGKDIGRPKVVFNRQEVHRLASEGLSVRAIATQLGLSIGTVHRTLTTAIAV